MANKLKMVTSFEGKQGAKISCAGGRTVDNLVQ